MTIIPDHKKIPSTNKRIVLYDNMISSQTGYIALMSAIILSLVLLTVTFIVSFTSFFTRSNILDAEHKAQSVNAAVAYANLSMLRFANGVITPLINIPVGNAYCSILAITPSGNQAIVTLQGISDNAYTNIIMHITRNESDISLDSWQEI